MTIFSIIILFGAVLVLGYILNESIKRKEKLAIFLCTAMLMVDSICIYKLIVEHLLKW